MAKTTSKRREQILAAAERLFQHYGFGKTTVADIARAAQVGVGTVYLEFPSKGDIAYELSLRRHDCVLAAMREVADGDGSFADRLQRMFVVKLDWLAQFAEAGPHGQELIRGACLATNRAHEAFWETQETLLSGFLEAAVDAGEFQVAEPRQAARLLLRVLHSYTAQADSHGGQVGGDDPDRLRAEIYAAYQLLLYGLLVR